MPRLTARERRERYLREYDFKKRTGKPFFPFAIFHDAVVSLFVVALIILMAILWKHGFGPVPDDPNAAREGGFLGPAYEGKADPGVESYEPRPEWYYFFLFELLRIFKTPELLLFGTIIIPTIWMVLLIGWPFIDRGTERRVSRRPFAMAIGAAVPVMLLALTWYGSKAPGAAGEASNHYGALAIQNNACATCHSLADAGIVGNVGPNLDTAKPDYNTAIEFITNGKGGMPAFKGQLSDDQISCFAGYIATWAGSDGTAVGPNAAGVPAGTYPDTCTAAGGDYAPAGATAK